MNKHIKIEFTVNQEQYKEYENIIQELLNNLVDIGIYDTDIQKFIGGLKNDHKTTTRKHLS